jgi:V-type H+-transporting ATPase subunit e
MVFFGAGIPFVVMTSVFGFIGIILPILIPKGPNQGVTRVMLTESAVCCYIFWVCTILMQLNPLIGPQLSNTTIYVMQHEWKCYAGIDVPLNATAD